MNIITGGGVFSRQNISDINGNFSELSGGVGNVVYCNPSSSYTGSQDGSSAKPYQSFATAYGALRTGKNDVLVLVGNGLSSGTARIDAAFTWGKDAAHLVGACSPVLFGQRARLAPSSGTTAFANFFTITGSGCIFRNIQWYAGFTTGTTAAICLTISTGDRNYFQNCQITGMVDAASAADAGSRSLKIGSAGHGEHVFESCVIGADTITRTNANASVEFAGGTPRNAFVNCFFPAYGGSGGAPLYVLGTGASCVDRTNFFDNCVFSNAIKSGATAMTTVGSFTSASPGGLVHLHNCMTVGATKWGDTNFLANCYIDMPVVSQAAGGLGLTAS